MTDNTWSEIADVIIMLAQLAMQHGKEDVVRQQIEYKLERQLKRIEEERNAIHRIPQRSSRYQR